MNKKKIIYKSLGYTLFGLVLVLFVFIMDHLNSGRTVETTKWDLSIEGKIQYSCLTYNEMEKKKSELEKQLTSVNYKTHALAGIRSWMCENGWR